MQKNNMKEKAEIKDTIDLIKYRDKFEESSFWKKIIRFYSKIGKPVVEKALTLYYTLIDDDTPQWAKSIIYGALGYFILPLDLIPDLMPIVGFSDDLTAIITAITVITKFIKKEHKEKALIKANSLFKN